MEKKPKQKRAAKSRALVKYRRKTVLQALCEGKTHREAGLLAGYKPTSAKQQVDNLMCRPDIQLQFRSMLNKTITDNRLIDKYDQLLDATKVISANVINVNGDGMAEANSMTKDFIEVPDYPTQLKSADSISKLKGHMMDSNQTNVQINFENLTDRQLQDLIDGKALKE